MGQLVSIVWPQPKHVSRNAQIDVPLKSLGAPIRIPLCRVRRWDKKLHLHLFEFACAENKITGSDLVTKRLTDLGNTKGRTLAAGLQYVAKVNEHSLSSLGTQIHLGATAFNRTGHGLKHQIEASGFGELATLFRLRAIPIF